MRRTEPSRRHSTSTTMSMVTTFIKILTEGRIFIRFIKQVTESEWIQRSKVEIKGKLFLIKKAVRLRHMNYFLSTGSLPVSAHSEKLGWTTDSRSAVWEAGTRPPGPSLALSQVCIRRELEGKSDSKNWTRALSSVRNRRLLSTIWAGMPNACPTHIIVSVLDPVLPWPKID